MHNLAPPPLATPKSSAVSGGSRTHRRTTSRLPERGEGDRGGPTRVLPSLPESRSCPGVQNEGWRRTGRRRAQGPRAHNLTHAPHTRRASAPARSPSRLRSAGRSPVAWASAPGRGAERSGARPPPLAGLAWRRRTLQGKSPQHPAPHARTPRVHGEREEGPGPAGARVWTQTYPALRAPLPPLEDAPLPPRPLPGRPGSGREERCEGAENGFASAPAPRRPGLGSPRCAGAACSLRRRVAARPPAAPSPALPGARRRSLF
ncbi:translation initiation factor IF-2-like [Zalophus californianus]|uniref:Translation initiation factor IF-2-like n=1 Tax=Zalophus californianus TaxID=9704 RepID=A0A6J2CWP4_ZALCA|nr:translation initiation factor IF-2-like [Zalophus californianus]